jgi:hypothetical protein
MSGIFYLKKEISLKNTQNGKITIGIMEKPYGENSSGIVSIAITLDGKNTDWKIHIPNENLDDVILTLQELQELKNKKNRSLENA